MFSLLLAPRTSYCWKIYILRGFMLFWLIGLGGVVLSAVCSQSALDFFIILLALGWVGRLFQKQGLERKWQWLGIEWAFALYFIVVCVGFMVNAAPDAPWRHALLKFFWIFHLYILIFAFRQIRLRVGPLVKYFTLAFVLPSLYALASYVHGVDFITGRENSRITGLVNSATYHAHGNALIFVFFSALLLLGWKKISKKWLMAAGFTWFVLGLSILLTFTRGIWLSIFVSSFLMLFLWNFKRSLQFAFVVVLLLGGTYAAWPKFHDRVNTLFMKDGGDPQRTDLFKVNVQIWKEYPWLGIGYGENLRRNREYWDRPEWNRPPGYITSHAHNQILNVMSTTGILGLIPFMFFWLFFMFKNWRLLRRTDGKRTPFKYSLYFGCMWAQIEFFLACFTDVGFEYAKIRILILAVWALVIALERKPEIALEDNLS